MKNTGIMTVVWVLILQRSREATGGSIFHFSFTKRGTPLQGSAIFLCFGMCMDRL